MKQFFIFFFQEHSTALEDDLLNGGDAPFRKVLHSIITRKPGNDAADPAVAKEDAKKMDDTFQAKDHDKSVEAITQLMATKSRPQVKAVVNAYDAEFKKPIEDGIKETVKAPTQQGLIAIIGAYRSPPVFFAQRLNAAMNGYGLKYPTLTRIIVSRCENDLGNVKKEYERLFGKTLASDIEEETFGDYETALTALVKGN